MYLIITTVKINHPIHTLIIILITRLLISSILLFYTISYWIALFIFITFIGGILVVFIYVVSLNPNEEEYNTLPPITIILILSIFSSKTTYLINTNNFLIRYFLSQAALVLIISFIGLIISSSSKLILSPLKTLKTTNYEKKHKISSPHYQINI